MKIYVSKGQIIRSIKKGNKLLFYEGDSFPSGGGNTCLYLLNIHAKMFRILNVIKNLLVSLVFIDIHILIVYLVSKHNN